MVMSVMIAGIEDFWRGGATFTVQLRLPVAVQIVEVTCREKRRNIEFNSRRCKAFSNLMALSGRKLRIIRPSTDGKMTKE